LLVFLLVLNWLIAIKTNEYAACRLEFDSGPGTTAITLCLSELILREKIELTAQP
jgi:hypothetical protein